jgi:hypothetical protein
LAGENRVAVRGSGALDTGPGLLEFGATGTGPARCGTKRSGGVMARHNRDGRGTDQNGSDYAISYQPDWLRQVKVTRNLENGRQSTKTLFRNPTKPEREPGRRVRTRVVSEAEELDFEIGLHDPNGVVTRVTVETTRRDRTGEASTIRFTFTDGHVSRKRRRRTRSPG